MATDGNAQRINLNNVTRRNLIAASILTTLPALLYARRASAFTWRGVGANLKSVFNGATDVLSGKFLFDGANLAHGTVDVVGGLGATVKELPSAIRQIKEAVGEIKETLKSVNKTLVNVNRFIAACDTVLDEISEILKDLPEKLNELQLRQEFGRLRGHTAVMSSYLNSINSIKLDRDRIQTKCEDIITSLSVIDATKTNFLQYTMQVVPALTIWINGYAAYNFLRSPSARDVNPWDHPVLAQIVLPSLIKGISDIKAQRHKYNELTIQTPYYKPGVVYTQDPKTDEFKETAIPFKSTYTLSDLWGDDYYTAYFCVLPANASPQGDYDAVRTKPAPSTMAYLVRDQGTAGRRYWAGPPMDPNAPSSPPIDYQSFMFRITDDMFKIAKSQKTLDIVEYFLAMQALAGQEVDARNLRPIVAMSEGIDAFEEIVHQRFVQADRTFWQAFPAIK